MNKVRHFLCLALPASVMVGCGSNSTLDALKTTLGITPVTSPTASNSTSLVMAAQQEMKGIIPISLGMYRATSTSAPTDVKPFSTMKTELENNFTQSSSKIAEGLTNFFTTTTYSANCYGPSWTDDATGSTVNRPSGDLMMVGTTSTPTATQACAAAQLNALVGGYPAQLNKILKLQQALVVGAASSEVELPAIGSEIDVKANLPTVTGVTFTSAKLSRLSNRTADSLPVYKTVMEFTDASGNTGSVTVYHTPLKTDNSDYTGAVQVVLPYTPTSGALSGAKQGLSMVYRYESSVLTFVLETAGNRSTASSDFFSTSTYRVDFSKTAFGEQGNKMIGSFDTANNVQTVHYAWQAGSNDGAVRTFAATVSGALGSRSGTAYAGFGSAISSLTDSTVVLWANKVFCNWISGGSGGSSVGKVQGMGMTESAGELVPVSAKTFISFAPTNTCSTGSAWTVSNSTLYAGSKSAVTHNLVDPNTASVGTVSAVTVPSYTKD